MAGEGPKVPGATESSPLLAGSSPASTINNTRVGMQALAPDTDGIIRLDLPPSTTPGFASRTYGKLARNTLLRETVKGVTDGAVAVYIATVFDPNFLAKYACSLGPAIFFTVSGVRIAGANLPRLWGDQKQQGSWEFMRFMETRIVNSAGFYAFFYGLLSGEPFNVERSTALWVASLGLWPGVCGLLKVADRNVQRWSVSQKYEYYFGEPAALAAMSNLQRFAYLSLRGGFMTLDGAFRVLSLVSSMNTFIYFWTDVIVGGLMNVYLDDKNESWITIIGMVLSILFGVPSVFSNTGLTRMQEFQGGSAWLFLFNMPIISAIFCTFGELFDWPYALILLPIFVMSLVGLPAAAEINATTNLGSERVLEGIGCGLFSEAPARIEDADADDADEADSVVDGEAYPTLGSMRGDDV